MSFALVPFLTDHFNPPSVEVSPWVTDENLRYWINMRPAKDKTFTSQFLDDMQEFIDGLDDYNWDRPKDRKITLLVGQKTDEKIAARDMEDLGATRIRPQFAIKYKNRIHEGEYYVDGVAMVYGIWFNPHRMLNNRGAFYFGYNPPRDFEQYMDWLIDRNPFKFERPPMP